MVQEKGPLWSGVDMLDNGKGKCKHCGLEFIVNGTRLLHHYTGGAPRSISACSMTVPLTDEIVAAISAKTASNVNKRKRVEGQPSLSSIFGDQKSEAADLAIAEMIIGCALPFNLLRSDFFKRFVLACKETPKGYKPPSSEIVRTKLLEKVEQRCETSLKPIKDEYEVTGVTLTSDAWDNVSGDHLLNVMFVSPGGTVFHDAHNCSAEKMTGAYIAQHICEAIKEAGPANVVQACTSPTSCKMY